MISFICPLNWAIVDPVFDYTFLGLLRVSGRDWHLSWGLCKDGRLTYAIQSLCSLCQ